MSKILLYSEPITGVTTNGEQHAFFINQNGIPTVKHGSQVITFGTSGYAFAGSSGSSGINGTSGATGSSGSSGMNGETGGTGSSGSSGMNGTNGSSGSSGANGLGAKSKAGSVALNTFTGDPLIYDVVFIENYGNTNYSVNTYATGNEAQGFGGFYPYITNKTVSGFTINTGLTGPLDPAVDDVVIDWLAISQGETGVAGSSGVSGTSGTSAPGGGGGYTESLYTQYVGVAAEQPALTGGSTQWHSIYGDGLQLDQGSGGGYDGLEVGFLQPFFLAPGETIEKVAFYMMDYISTGSGAFKLIICDKHPSAYLPWNIVHSEELTMEHDGMGNKFVSWDYNFTNTGTTMNTYFFYILFQNEVSRTFEICRTVQYPQHLTGDYRFVSPYNRFDSNSHWITIYTNIYDSLPTTMSGVLDTHFFYNNQRGGHIYYQTSRI